MNNKKRILVIGSPGAGKTYFANCYGKICGLEVIHLDDYYWKANWKHYSDQEWNKILKKLLQKDSYIMDGNYLNSLKMRVSYADEIICINTGVFMCLLGYTRRTLTNLFTKGSQLPKLIRLSNYHKLSECGYFSFCRYIIAFHRKNKKDLLLWLKQLKAVEVKILTTRQAKMLIFDGENKNDYMSR